MLISIIIVTYFSSELIEECIASIYRYNDLKAEEIEVIVVDNSGEEEFQKLQRIIIEKFGNAVKIIKNRNGGYGQGNNTGFIASTGKIICIMNPDVRFIEPLLKTVVETFEKKHDIGLVAFKQIGGHDLSFYFKPEYEMPIVSSILIKRLNKKNHFNREYHFLSGAFFFIDREKFKKAGTFDENIFMYYEESDLAKRMSNYDFVFIPEKKYVHLVSERESMSHTSFVNSLKSLAYYLQKYGQNKTKVYRNLILDYRLKRIISKIVGQKEKSLHFDKYLKLLKENKSLFK